MTAWSAPVPEQVIDCQVRIPGSKSLTNRYFVLAALGDEPSRIRFPLIARDTVLMAKGLEAMGASVVFDGDDAVVTPGPLHGGKVDAGLAGTVMRFLPAVAMLADGDVTVDGDLAARVRPVDPVVRAIKALGIDVTHDTDAAGRAVLPLTVHSRGNTTGGLVEIDASASSQFISALLLAAPRMRDGLTIVHSGATIPSLPHIEMTCDVLRSAGIEVESFAEDGGAPSPENPAVRWTVQPGVPRLGEVIVEPDLSNAGPFLAAAMVTGGSVTIPEWPLETTQVGDAYREIFALMGGSVDFSRSWGETGVLRVTGPETITPIDLNLHHVGEIVPTVAAVAAFATGTSALRDIGQLRGHETDRLRAITTEIERAGGRAWVEGDDLFITGSALTPATIESYEDHRMATFGAIIGLRVPGTRVLDIATTSKTFPQFPRMWSRMTNGDEIIEPVVPAQPGEVPLNGEGTEE